MNVENKEKKKREKEANTSLKNLKIAIIDSVWGCKTFSEALNALRAIVKLFDDK